MGISLTVYIGPYFIIPKDSGFDWYDWDAFVCDGRGEAGVGESDLILIPNRDLDGIDRDMHVDRLGQQQVVNINPATIVRECGAFARMAGEVIKHCDDHGIEIRQAWGIVPCWS